MLIIYIYLISLVITIENNNNVQNCFVLFIVEKMQLLFRLLSDFYYQNNIIFYVRCYQFGNSVSGLKFYGKTTDLRFIFYCLRRRYVYFINGHIIYYYLLYHTYVCDGWYSHVFYSKTSVFNVFFSPINCIGVQQSLIVASTPLLNKYYTN